MNFLEELAAEWYEWQGYFVRRNVLVGRRAKGGWEGELDVVAFHPGRSHLVHVECSMDALSWAKRDLNFARKFGMGRKHVSPLFKGLGAPRRPDQIALLGLASKRNRQTVGGAPILLDMHKEWQVIASLRDLAITPLLTLCVSTSYLDSQEDGGPDGS